MQPRPIYHWKSFWLGLLVLSFIGWAWLDSKQSWTYMRCRQFVLSHAGAGVSLAVWGPGGEYRDIPLWNRQMLSDSYSTWKQAGFEAPAAFLCSRGVDHLPDLLGDSTITYTPKNSASAHFLVASYSNAIGTRSIFIPHWLLILLFLIPWSAVLVWRWRRALSESSNEPPCEPHHRDNP
jgi:hypothetical protein